MTKEKTIERLKNGHEYLRKAIDRLDKNKMDKDGVLGDWTIKDIVAHLSAWNWEQVKSIDDLLSNKKPSWWGLDENDFNQREINKRKDWDIEKILREWDDSFKELFNRAGRLTDEEWIHEACKIEDDGLPVNIESMLSYEYRNEDHEKGHATQIEEYIRAQKT